MRVHVAIAIVLACLLLAGATLAQPGPVAGVEPGSASAGGGYRLVRVEWQIEGGAAGGLYRLWSPAVPDRQSSGCCCTFLPCALRTR